MFQEMMPMSQPGGGEGGFIFKEDVHKLANSPISFSATVGKEYIVVIISGWSNSNYPNRYCTIVSYTGLTDLESVVSPTTYLAYTGGAAQYQFSVYSFKATDTTVTISRISEENTNNVDCLVFEHV